VSAGVPASGPERPVLVFDGDCAFCTTSARWATRLLRLDRVEPWQRLDLAALGLDEDRCEQALQWVAVDGSIQSAEWAVIAALRHAGGLWRVPAGILAAPGVRVLAGASYRWVARNRHRLPGGAPACRL
jgi:predicted DCC family thiol-disulfide oxidoreductase YuxK